jgi:hypothetical protein
MASSLGFGTLARDLSEEDAKMRSFESSHIRMGLDDATTLKSAKRVQFSGTLFG